MFRPGRLIFISFIIAAIMLGCFGGNVVLGAPPISQYTVLVKFRAGVSQLDKAALHKQQGGTVRRIISGIDVEVVDMPAGKAESAAASYAKNNHVQYAEVDRQACAVGSVNDYYFVNGYQWALAKVQAPQAWDLTTGSSSISIAILDTGVDMSHPDLSGKVVGSMNYSSSSTAGDVYGHGTHVAGIAAAATNNGIGVAGLGYNSTIMNVKVLNDNGAGAYSAIASGIIWAADHGAQVINMSLGGSSPSSVLEDAINYAWSKGVVIVAAAGNNGNSVPFYPAYYQNVIAVASTDPTDALAPYSDCGDWVDVAAPGDSIWSTKPNNSYGYLSGTSMASPQVAGLAALVFTRVKDSNGNGLLNDEVRGYIQNNADNIGVSGIGSGRINAYRAVSAAASDPAPGQPPTAVIAATPFSGNAPLAIFFDGSASKASAGIASYSWLFGDSSSGSGVTISHTYAAAGSYIAKLTVTDNQGATGSNSVTINVSSPTDIPPTAVASALPSSGYAPLAVTFSGAGSSDPDGSIASYAWNFGDGSTSAGVSVAHAYSSAGSYTATLTVTDNQGAASSAGTIINVVNPISLNAPASLSATAGVGTAKLTWKDNSTNESGFYIERGTKAKNSVTYTQAGKVSANVTTFTDNVSPGTYYYRVRAFNSTTGALSGYSNEVSVRVR